MKISNDLLIAAQQAYQAQQYLNAIKILSSFDDTVENILSSQENDDLDKAITVLKLKNASILRGASYVQLSRQSNITEQERKIFTIHFLAEKREEEVYQGIIQMLVNDYITNNQIEMPSMTHQDETLDISLKPTEKPEQLTKKSRKKKKKGGKQGQSTTQSDLDIQFLDAEFLEIQLQLFNEAQRLYDEEKFDDSLQALKNLIQHNPEYWSAYLICLNIYSKKGDDAQLVLFCNNIIQKITETEENKELLYRVHYHLAANAIRNKAHRTAMNFLAIANRLKSNTLEVALQYGLIAEKEVMDDKQYELKVFGHVKLPQEDLQSKNEMIETGINCYTQALEEHPENNTILRGLAMIYFYKKDYDKSKQYYTKMKKLDLNDPELITLEAQLALKEYQYDLAIEKYEELLSNPICIRCLNMRSEILFNIGFVYEKQEKFSEAYDAYHCAISISPDHFPAIIAQERLMKLNSTKNQPIIKVNNEWAWIALPVLESLINNATKLPNYIAFILVLAGQVYSKSRLYDLAFNCYEAASHIHPLNTVEQRIFEQLKKIPTNHSVSQENIRSLILRQSQEIQNESQLPNFFVINGGSSRANAVCVSEKASCSSEDACESLLTNRPR